MTDEIDPETARSIPYEEWPDEWKNPNTRVGVDYVKSEDPDIPLTADMFAGMQDLAGLPPMSEWKPFIPQGLVHAEADRAASAAKALTDDMSWKKGMTDRQIMMIYDLIAAVDRLVPRYKELWDIASGIVNKEMLDEGR